MRFEIGFEWSKRPGSSSVNDDPIRNQRSWYQLGSMIGSSRDDQSRSCGESCSRDSSRKTEGNPCLESMSMSRKASRKEICRVGGIGIGIESGVQGDNRRQEYHWMS